VIGILERLLIFLGLVASSWEILAGVVALKTVARYSDLDKQDKAEYFLIGSLASILWAVVVSAPQLAPFPLSRRVRPTSRPTTSPLTDRY
jgi:hypothetical protein